MTLRAYLITLRGRIREALVPELQELRDRATIAEQNAQGWAEWARGAMARTSRAEADARRGRFLLDKMRHQQCGPNEGWTLDELYPGDDPESAVDAAMAKETRNAD